MTKFEPLLEKWNAMQPFSAADAAKLERKFKIEFNYNSNHIEGNTLTYGQTELLLLFGEIVGSANMKDLEEMKAHDVCLKMIQDEAVEKANPLTEVFVRQLHKVMMREDYSVTRALPGGLPTTYTVHAGTYKTRPNSVITKTGERFDYASPEETPSLMYDLIRWYNEAEAKGELSPIKLAALFHYRYIRIHPFEDGNGRIARLIMNYILLRHSYPMIVIRSKTKDKYLEALHRADIVIGQVPSDGSQATIEQIKSFSDYLQDVAEKEIADNIRYITESGRVIWWYDGDFITFRSQNTGKILDAITENPTITVRALAGKMGINKSAVQKQLDTLKEKGYIVRSSDNKGAWHVAIFCTTEKGGTK